MIVFRDQRNESPEEENDGDDVSNDVTDKREDDIVCIHARKDRIDLFLGGTEVEFGSEAQADRVGKDNEEQPLESDYVGVQPYCCPHRCLPCTHKSECKVHQDTCKERQACEQKSERSLCDRAPVNDVNRKQNEEGRRYRAEEKSRAMQKQVLVIKAKSRDEVPRIANDHNAFQHDFLYGLKESCNRVL